MKKVAIISLTNLYLTPYMDTYVKKAIEKSYKIDFIYWDRHRIDESEIYKDKVNLIPFKSLTEETSSKIEKLKKYLKFRRFSKCKLKEEEYDRVIFLHTISALMLTCFLKKSYRYKYLVDIRDYSIEGSIIMRAIEKVLISNSKMNVISSEYYKKFLPKGKYIVAHNYTKLTSDIFQTPKEEVRYGEINIYYIGLVRFDDKIKWFIDSIKNSERIVFHVVGQGANRFKKYIQENNIDNVVLEDFFNPKKSETILKKADIIFNLYGFNTPLLDYALSNKLYYAAQLKVPILTFEGTAMSEVAKKYGFGISIYQSMFSSDSSTLEKYIIKEYELFYENKLYKKSEEFIKIVEAENENYNKAVGLFYTKQVIK